MDAMDDVVPAWVAGFVGCLCFVLLLVVFYVAWKIRKESPSESQGSLQTAFAGLVATLSIFAVLAVSVASSLLCMYESRATTGSAFEKWGSRASFFFNRGQTSHTRSISQSLLIQ